MPSAKPLSNDLSDLARAWGDYTKGFRSLDPQSKNIPSLSSLIEEMAESMKDDMAEGLVELARCSVKYFPQNIFFDCRYLAEWLAFNASDEPEPIDALRQSFNLLYELFELFGNATSIRFRYVHDFLYGYDWSRWIQKHPEDAQWHPYSSEFFRIMIRRGREIIQAIEEGDPLYPPLAREAGRNRFAFNREPEQEAALCYAMAAKKQIPLPAWEAGCATLLLLDYHELRKAWASQNLLSNKGVDRGLDVLEGRGLCL